MIIGKGLNGMEEVVLHDEAEEIRLKHIFVGVDLHKQHHTAVFLNGFKRKLGEFKFNNRPSEFPKLLEESKKYLKKGMKAIYGLEDTGGYGRALAVFLVENKQIVKEVNAALPNGIRKANPHVQKYDAWDAECVGQVLVDQLERLPNANPIDMYWVISQLVTTRTAIAGELNALINQLHAQLGHHYPSYKKFFSELDGKTSLAFFERFPAPCHLKDLSEDILRDFLIVPSNYSCSLKKAEQILSLVKSDGDTKCEYQEERDFIIQSHIRRIRNCKKELSSIEERLDGLIKGTSYKLDSMEGIDVVTAAGFIAEIGDIGRFSSSDKLARFSGIAPLMVGSGDNHKHYKSKQGNRTLHELFYRLACRQINVTRGKDSKPKNPYYYEYYQQKLAVGKTKKQAIVCIMRKLVDVIFAMMKNRSIYVKPEVVSKLAG
jgi:transposase